MIILDSILLFQVLEFICLTYFVLLIISRNSHERQATQCFTSPRISPIKEDGDTVEIIVDCWSKYRVKVRKNRRFFVCYVFFPLGGRKGGEGGVGKRDKKLSCASFFNARLPLLGRSFIPTGRNRGQRES